MERRVAWLGLSWFFLWLEYVVRVSDSVIVPELSQAFGLTSADLGWLSSGYYWAYVGMMLPAGYLLDRWGVKRALILAITGVAVGTVLLAWAESLGIAILARVLMGLGSAFALLASIKLVHSSVMPERRAIWVGVTMTIAMLGAVFGQAPWLAFTEWLGNWRQAYGFAALLLAGLALAAVWLKDDASTHSQSPHPRRVPRLKEITGLLSWSRGLRLLLYVFLLNAVSSSFVAFWAVPMLHEGWGVSRMDAAELVSISWLGSVVGGPLCGYIASTPLRAKWLLIACGLLTAVLTLVILYLAVPEWVRMISFLTIGIVVDANIVVFAIMVAQASQAQSGMSAGLTNVFNMAGGPIFQVLIGYQLLSHSDLIGSASLENFQSAVVIIPLMLVVITGLLVPQTAQSFDSNR